MEAVMKSLLVLLVLVSSFRSDIALGRQLESTPGCEAGGPVTMLPDLPEASGVAVSRKSPNIVWVHNDSGAPVLFGVDTRGSIVARVRLAGVSIKDWEDVAVGPCPAGSCLYIADIGDNDTKRSRITVYRISEPFVRSGTIAVKDAFHARYPQGPQDAETLVATANGALYIVTRGRTGSIGLYRFPDRLRPGSTVTLEYIGVPAMAEEAVEDQITGGAASADGRRVVLRGHHTATMLSVEQFETGTWKDGIRIDLGTHEPQGEGIAVGEDGTVYLVSEGEGESAAGMLSQLRCRFPR
jgi:hypothetical protein